MAPRPDAAASGGGSRHLACRDPRHNPLRDGVTSADTARPTNGSLPVRVPGFEPATDIPAIADRIRAVLVPGALVLATFAQYEPVADPAYPDDPDASLHQIVQHARAFAATGVTAEMAELGNPATTIGYVHGEDMEPVPFLRNSDVRITDNTVEIHLGTSTVVMFVVLRAADVPVGTPISDNLLGTTTQDMPSRVEDYALKYDPDLIGPAETD